MKIKTLISLALFLSVGSGCHAQYLVHNRQEIYKIQENNKRFINKPLDTLLSAIKPPIRIAIAEMTPNSPASGYFIFRFNTPQEFLASIGKDSSEPYLQVYLKEPFEWNPKPGGRDEKATWTGEDVKKYGNLTVIRIKVLGGKKRK